MISVGWLVAIILCTALLGVLLGYLICLIVDENSHGENHLYKCDRCGRIIDGKWSKVILPKGYADKRRVHLCFSCRTDIEDGKPYLSKDIELLRIKNGRKD